MTSSTFTSQRVYTIDILSLLDIPQLSSWVFPLFYFLNFFHMHSHIPERLFEYKSSFLWLSFIRKPNLIRFYTHSNVATFTEFIGDIHVTVTHEISLILFFDHFYFLTINHSLKIILSCLL